MPGVEEAEIDAAAPDTNVARTPCGIASPEASVAARSTHECLWAQHTIAQTKRPVTGMRGAA